MKAVRIVAVRHAQKANLPPGLSTELYADQPLSKEGMLQAIVLGHHVKQVFGVPDTMFAGNSQRTLQTASIMHKVTGATCPIETIWGLYHMGSDHDGQDTYYPGFENWSWSQWQAAAVGAFDRIATSRLEVRFERPTIVVATSVAIASFECHLLGVHEVKAIEQAIISWPDRDKRYSLFEYDPARGFRYQYSG